MSERKYWLMKSEPDVFGIDDMEKAGVEPWDGIRNYAARNYMKPEMKIGDKVFFYHSNAKPMAIVGTMEVASEPYPDPTQFDPKAKYFDPKSKESDPKWHLVDVRFVQKFEHPVTREAMKEESALDNMELFRLSRLSITPVREEEWNKIMEMAGVKG